MANETNQDDQDPINRAFSKLERLQEKLLGDADRMLDKKIASDNESQKITNRLQSRTTIGGYLALAVTIGVGAAGIMADAYMKNQDRDDQTLRQATQRKMQIISDVSNAITGMREYQELRLLSCNVPLDSAEALKIKQEKLKRDFALVQVLRPVYHHFDEKFRSLMIDFVMWDYGIKDYCDKNAPSETVWKQKQKEIEDHMLLSPIEKFFDI